MSVLKQRKGNFPNRPLGSNLDCSTWGTVLEWKEDVVWVQRPSDTASPLTCSLSFAISHPLCLSDSSSETGKDVNNECTGLCACLQDGASHLEKVTVNTAPYMSDEDYQKRGTTVNQQETPFIRPEGTKGTSPTQGFSTTARVLPTAARLLLNMVSWQTPRERVQRAGNHFSLKPSTRKTWGDSSNIPYMIRTVPCCFQAPAWPQPHLAFPTDHNVSTFKSPSTHTFLSLILKEEGTRVGERTGGDKTERRKGCERNQQGWEKKKRTKPHQVRSVSPAVCLLQTKETEGSACSGCSHCVEGHEDFCRTLHHCAPCLCSASLFLFQTWTWTLTL